MGNWYDDDRRDDDRVGKRGDDWGDKGCGDGCGEKDCGNDGGDGWASDDKSL